MLAQWQTKNNLNNKKCKRKSFNPIFEKVFTWELRRFQIFCHTMGMEYLWFYGARCSCVSERIIKIFCLSRFPLCVRFQWCQADLDFGNKRAKTMSENERFKKNDVEPEHIWRPQTFSHKLCICGRPSSSSRRRRTWGGHAGCARSSGSVRRTFSGISHTDSFEPEKWYV